MNIKTPEKGAEAEEGLLNVPAVSVRDHAQVVVAQTLHPSSARAGEVKNARASSSLALV